MSNLKNIIMILKWIFLVILDIFLTLDIDSLCLRWSSDNTTCEICDKSYWNADSQICSRDKLMLRENCLSYESIKEPKTNIYKTCNLCNFGFSLNKSQCIQCEIPLCAVCPNTKSCIACSEGFVPSEDNQKCVRTYERFCKIEGCLICGTNDKGIEICLECQQGMAIKGDEKRCQHSQLGCRVLNFPIEDTCLECRSGLFQVKNERVKR